jgi:predicted DNA-binding helix-hairpin-helix protein
MDIIDRLKLLTAQMHLEPADDIGFTALPQRKKDSIVTSTAVLPNGKKIKLLKTLLTSVCERDCYYCPFRAGRDFRRATFTPAEFATLFMQLYNRGIADGIFLSSGVINGGIFSQDKLLDTATILRRKYQFKGYIHLKIMPGAQKTQVEEAMRLADRVSINLEAPNRKRLTCLTPNKNFEEELLRPLDWIEEIRQEKPGSLTWNGYWPSSVTQFVVGVAGETDQELLITSQKFYQKMRLKRVYYSAFSPIIGTPFENRPPASPMREHRLFEASFLIRDYGFNAQELQYDTQGNLPLSDDPKLAWAKSNLHDPVEINQADRNELIKIPGIGIKSAARILQSRKNNIFHNVNDLLSIGINISRAAPFITINGRSPEQQLRLF